MNEKHEKGHCHICRQNTMVRWKNIYWIGSEALTVCQPCENKIVNFVQSLVRQRQTIEINKRKFEKIKQKEIKS